MNQDVQMMRAVGLHSARPSSKTPTSNEPHLSSTDLCHQIIQSQTGKEAAYQTSSKENLRKNSLKRSKNCQSAQNLV